MSESNVRTTHIIILLAFTNISSPDLLAPLTAASELPDHPTLSKPFTSKTLTELTRQAGDMVQKEKQSLWRIKHLLTRLSGDKTWIPCESVQTENDFSLFLDERDRHAGSILGKAIVRDEGDQVSTGTLVSEEGEQPMLLTIEAHSSSSGQELASQDVGKSAIGDEEVVMTPSAELSSVLEKEKPDALAESSKSNEPPKEDVHTNGGGWKPAEPTANEEAMDVDKAQTLNPDDTLEDLVEPGEEGVEDQDGIPAPHRMRTRAQAQAASDNTVGSRTRSLTPDSANEISVHPYFLAPRASYGDRNVGLPQHEAEETRRLLQLYIQKQEEVCRGAQRVYEGLLRADRYRKLVMKWAKAEGHVGLNRDMSDGEDWYDKEEWGLEEDLKKGQDEEEEDAATTAKKTRTRRQ